MVRGFIPAGPLLFAQGMLLISWIALFALGTSGSFGLSPVSLVWIHAVVLGWLTTTSLAFMIHVIPGFTDVQWRFEVWARGSIVAFEAGVSVLVLGFWLWQPPLLAVGGATIAAALCVFSFAFLATIASVLRNADRAATAAARAFVIVVASLLAAAAIGLFMSASLASGRAGALRLAPIHGTIGIVGWIALLVAGVSTRTFNRLIGPEDRRLEHIITSSMALTGFSLWVAGAVAGVEVLQLCGGVALAASACFYAGTTLRSLQRSAGRHRLPQEFLCASMVWLLVSVLLGAASLAGFDLWSATLFALLIGWVGQTVNAHLMHTGIRLLATLVIHEDDLTQPVELLDRRRGVASLVTNQVAVFLGIVGLATGTGFLVQISALAGIGSMLAMALNVLYAFSAARRRPIAIPA